MKEANNVKGTSSILRGTIYNLFPTLLIKTNNQELEIQFAKPDSWY